MPRRKDKAALGRCLVKQKNNVIKSLNTRGEIYAAREIVKDDDAALFSVTEQNPLQEFLSRARMCERNYEARHLDVKIVSSDTASGILTEEQKEEISRLQQEHDNELRIPRRPAWNRDTTAAELHRSEEDYFIGWRIQLSKLSHIANLNITPYEKNVRVWQQLWRVVERSDVVMQIVDARNPLLFRCCDLECYVKEVCPSKLNLLLVNKSDHLSEAQREAWAQYFRDQNTYAVFFSALESSIEYDKNAGIVGDPLGVIRESDDEESEAGVSGDVDTCGTEEDTEQLLEDDDTDSTEGSVDNTDHLTHDTGDVDTDNEDDIFSDSFSTLSLKDVKDNDNSNIGSLLSTERHKTITNNSESRNCDSIHCSESPTDLATDVLQHSRDTTPLVATNTTTVTAAPLAPTEGQQSSSVATLLTTEVLQSNAVPSHPLVTTSKLYNREELIALMASLSPAPRLLQQYTTIGMVGFPNVGKSSTINCLMKEKKVTVSSTPGKTKHFQTLFLTPELLLCDCPGLVFPCFVSTKQEMRLWGILPIDRLRGDHYSTIAAICSKVPPAALEAAYSVPLPAGTTRTPTAEELCTAYSLTRGFMSARGRADTSRSARAIMKDFMTGRLLHCVAPPTVPQEEYHQHTVQPKCKNRVKLTPHQKIFMPETETDVYEHMHTVLGITTKEEEQPSGKKQRKPKVKKPKGYVEVREGPQGVEMVVTKPWKNKVKVPRVGKKNPNTNNPYDAMIW